MIDISNSFKEWIVIISDHLSLYTNTRSDIRNEEDIQGRSINMTIAKRGLDSLEAIGVKDVILKERYLHIFDTFNKLKSGNTSYVLLWIQPRARYLCFLVGWYKVVGSRSHVYLCKQIKLK